MQCEMIGDRLQDLLEGRLPPELSAEVRSHLDTCPACQADLMSWRDLWSALDGLAPCRIPPNLELRIVPALGTQPVLPRGLIAMFVLAGMGTLAGLTGWIDELGFGADLLSALLWTAAGAAAVGLVGLVMEERLRRAEPEEDSACTAHCLN